MTNVIGSGLICWAPLAARLEGVPSKAHLRSINRNDCPPFGVAIIIESNSLLRTHRCGILARFIDNREFVFFAAPLRRQPEIASRHGLEFEVSASCSNCGLYCIHAFATDLILSPLIQPQGNCSQCLLLLRKSIWIFTIGNLLNVLELSAKFVYLPGLRFLGTQSQRE